MIFQFKYQRIIAFTIIVIGFLGATAVNSTAQTSRSLFDRIADALERYAVDNGGNYPPGIIYPVGPYLKYSILNPVLTTPIAYLNPSDYRDPFSTRLPTFTYFNFQNWKSSPEYSYVSSLYGSWYLESGGIGMDVVYPIADIMAYDPTNGTLPLNNVVRSQRWSTEVGTPVQ